MPTHLGKLYHAEVVFENAFDRSVVLPITSNDVDIAKIEGIAKAAFASIKSKTMRTRMLKTLVDTSVGALLVSAVIK
jgi:hypothetical protein